MNLKNDEIIDLIFFVKKATCFSKSGGFEITSRLSILFHGHEIILESGNNISTCLNIS